MSPHEFVGKIYDRIYNTLGKLEDGIFNFGAMKADEFKETVDAFPVTQAGIYNELKQSVEKELTDEYGMDFAQYIGKYQVNKLKLRARISRIMRKVYKSVIKDFKTENKVNFYQHGGLFAASQNIYDSITKPVAVVPEQVANGNGAQQMNPANYRPVNAQA